MWRLEASAEQHGDERFDELRVSGVIAEVARPSRRDLLGAEVRDLAEESIRERAAFDRRILRGHRLAKKPAGIGVSEIGISLA